MDNSTIKSTESQEELRDFGEDPSSFGPTCRPPKWQDSEYSYIGTKVIRAMPMHERDFLIQIKGKTVEEVREQETQGDGYKVTYEDGYVSWSPKRVFEQCYRRISDKESDLMSNW